MGEVLKVWEPPYLYALSFIYKKRKVNFWSLLKYGLDVILILHHKALFS